MEFKKIKSQITEQFERMTQEVDYLLEVNVDKDILWNLYLDSFPEGTNKIFRERREYDCSCCRQFIKNIGSVVTVKNNKITTIWDIETECTTFKPVVETLSNYIRTNVLNGMDVYVSEFNKIGVDSNFENTSNGVIEWEHFYLEIPTKFVNRGTSSIGEIRGKYRDIKNVFKRSLNEINIDSILTVIDLIDQKSLYRGEEWRNALSTFLQCKREYEKLNGDLGKELFAWEVSLKVGAVVGKIRNHSIGTLLLDISNEESLDKAVTKYEKIVAPSNYKRPKAIFTKKMLEDAKNTITELGYMDSLERRHATLDDIVANNILFVNKDSAKKIGAIDIFDELSKEVSVNSKKFSKVEEISIEDFVKNVVPTAREIELLVENKHTSNFMSLIAPVNKDAKTMFKWDNNFSWAYNGNMADSSLKENVKNAGGDVEGVLRFSIQWNDVEYDNNDLDAHCIEPSGNQIYFGRKGNISTSGKLDVDIQRPNRDEIAVENITWTDLNKMQKGKYKFFVNNFANRSGRSGFRAEIEFNGEIYSFDYSKPLKTDEKVYVAEVTLNADDTFSIKELLPSNVSNREEWGITTNQFVPVSVLMHSPNYWDEQEGKGNKHYFFLLKDCKNPNVVNGFYNEYLKNELNTHKRVFEALGSKMSVEYNENQLSGVGFSSTKRNEVIVKVKGTFERVLKIKF